MKKMKHKNLFTNKCEIILEVNKAYQVQVSTTKFTKINYLCFWRFLALFILLQMHQTKVRVLSVNFQTVFKKSYFENNFVRFWDFIFQSIDKFPSLRRNITQLNRDKHFKPCHLNKLVFQLKQKPVVWPLKIINCNAVLSQNSFISDNE